MDATFSGPPFDDEHRPGEPLARHVQAELAARGWDVAEVDNWRDSGWFFACKRGASELELILAAEEDPRWALQIRPIRGLGLLARMLGRSPSASPSEIYELARTVHEVLVANGSKELSWAGDGPDDTSWPEPPPPELPRATLRK